MFRGKAGNPWVAFLQRSLEAWQSESDNAELPTQDALEFLYETCAESRRDFSYGDGVTLSTVHAAKGTEYDHVLLIGTWPLNGARAMHEEKRRAFYVGMTRARQSLTIFERTDASPSLPTTLSGPAIFRPNGSITAPQQSAPLFSYEVLGLDDIHLGYAGGFGQGEPIHSALSALQPGDVLSLRRLPGGRLELGNAAGVCVARLSRKAETVWAERAATVREARVLALIHRGADQDDDPQRRAAYRIGEGEIPLVEIVTNAVSRAGDSGS